jgi:hypothetical protein
LKQEEEEEEVKQQNKGPELSGAFSFPDLFPIMAAKPPRPTPHNHPDQPRIPSGIPPSRKNISFPQTVSDIQLSSHPL